jgi:hypothetical protein
MYLVKNQNIFSSSQLRVSTVYGHHEAGTQEGNEYTVTFRTEISMHNCVLILFLVASLMMIMYG